MPRRAALSSNRWLKILAWTSMVIIVLVSAAGFVGQAWLNRYLRSPEFREKLETHAGIDMRAKVNLAPVRFEGTQFFTDGFIAQGAHEAGFSALNVEAIRGELNLPSIFRLLLGNRNVRIEKVEIQKVALDFYRDRIALALPERDNRGHSDAIGGISVREATIGWPGGGIKGAAVHASNSDGLWKIDATGGRLTQLGFPAIDLASARMVLKAPSLFLQEVRLAHDGGEVIISGEVTSSKHADLLFNIRDISVTPLLPNDWRARLHGRLGSEVRLVLPLGDHQVSTPVLSGKLALRDGVLEALPLLAKIAEFTKTDKFRKLPLHTLSADFQYDASGLRVTNLILESKQLIVLRGNLTVMNETVDGTFDIGITPGSLQLLPGSQERVFNTPGGGYAWTKMRVVGPVDSLSEDLTPRLIAAAEAAVVEKVERTTSGALGTAVDAAGGAVNAAKKAADAILSPLFGN